MKWEMTVLYLISNYRQQFIFRKKISHVLPLRLVTGKIQISAAQCAIAINLTPAVFTRAVTCNRKHFYFWLSEIDKIFE